MEEKPSLPPRLPDDIEADILLRLPVKSLKRFECVCKSWSSLISSPQFQLNHFRRAQQNPLLLTLQSDATMFDENRVDDLTLRFSVYNKDGTLVKKLSKPVPQPYFGSRIVGKPFVKSCRGLVCIASYAGPILVCNPSTEEMISLPPRDDPNHCFGIGYASSTEEFKLVSISYDDCCCEVFTLGTSCWRKARTPSPFPVYQGTAPFLNGAFHFLPEISFYGVKDTDCIAAFNIEIEDYKMIPLPEFYYGVGDCQGIYIASTGKFLRLTKLGGELCLTFDFGELDQRLEVWILKDYNKGEWVKGYDINVSPVCPYRSYFFRAFPSDSMGSESILLSCIVQEGFKVLSYNTEDGIVTLMEDKEWGATFYVESFYRLTDGSPSSEINVLGSKTEAIEGRIPVAVGGARKYGSVPKNKYDDDSEDGEDEYGEDGDIQDRDDRAADASGDEETDIGDEKGDINSSTNGEDWSDYENDDDEEDEEDEVIPHPPTKKRK